MVRILKLQMYFYHAIAENRRNKIKTRTQFQRNFEQGNQGSITTSSSINTWIRQTKTAKVNRRLDNSGARPCAA